MIKNYDGKRRYYEGPHRCSLCQSPFVLTSGSTLSFERFELNKGVLTKRHLTDLL